MLTFDSFARGSVIAFALACAAGSTNASSDDASSEEESVGVSEHGVATSDPFDSNYCQGAPIDDAQVVARFAPGGTHVDIGRFDVEARKRSCNVVTGCTAWVRVTTELLYTIHHEQDYRSWDETWRMPRTHRGSIAFDVVGGGAQLTLTSDPITYEDQYGARSAAVEFASPFAADRFDEPVSTLKMCEAGGPACNYAAWSGGGRPGFNSEASGIITNDCVRRLVAFRGDALPDGSQWTDYEYVWYARFK